MSYIGKILKKGVQQIPYVKQLRQRVHEFEKYISFMPGHYYSPITEPSEFIDQQNAGYNSPDFLPAEIDFNEKGQLKLLDEFTCFYKEIPFEELPSPGLRFSFNNVFFTYSDAITLYSMLRYFRPKKIIEIGSGFSSALILDTNELFLDNSVDLTFIEPNPERLLENIRADENVNIIRQKIQQVDLTIFSNLDEGDFLLIDTSHVSKSGGDVNFIYFNILPYLKKGVKIHIHDIFFPFEYPEKWVVEEKRSWNEIFLLRSFLAFNDSFRILFFNDFMEKRHPNEIKEKMPMLLKRNSTVCGGIWIEKIK